MHHSWFHSHDDKLPVIQNSCGITSAYLGDPAHIMEPSSVRALHTEHWTPQRNARAAFKSIYTVSFTIEKKY